MFVYTRTFTNLLGFTTLPMPLFSHVCPNTTQHVEKNLIPWRHDKLSELVDSNDKIFRPLFNAEKQCTTLTTFWSVAAKSMPRYIRQASCKVANITTNPMKLSVTL